MRCIVISVWNYEKYLHKNKKNKINIEYFTIFWISLNKKKIMPKSTISIDTVHARPLWIVKFSIHPNEWKKNSIFSNHFFARPLPVHIRERRLFFLCVQFFPGCVSLFLVCTWVYNFRALFGASSLCLCVCVPPLIIPCVLFVFSFFINNDLCYHILFVLIPDRGNNLWIFFSLVVRSFCFVVEREAFAADGGAFFVASLVFVNILLRTNRDAQFCKLISGYLGREVWEHCQMMLTSFGDFNLLFFEHWSFWT